MYKEQFDELKHTGQLPSPSGVGMRILMLTQEEDCALDELIRVIKTDPALTGRIVKLATSVLLSGNNHVASVKESAMRLGLRTVSNVALGFTLVSGNRSGKCEEFDYDRFWAWSLANGVAAQTASREFGIGDPAEAFTCGLLIRIGQLALASVHPSEYSEVLKELEEDPGANLEDIEREHFRINHREVAAAMMADWGLPESYSEAALNFNLDTATTEVEDAATYDLLRVMRASSSIAEVCLAQAEHQPVCWPPLKEICSDLDIPAVEFSRVFDQIVKDWTEWGSFLKVATNQVMSSAELEDRAREMARKESQWASPVTRKGLRILAVDDDPVSLRLLVRHLEKHGHQVVTATNGKEALAVALEVNPQIVVTDWMMPEMDGLELCKTLRRFGSGRNLYVLLLTGRSEEDRVVQAFEAGVDDYIVKPFKPKLLLARIRGGQRVIKLQEQVERDKKTQREQVAKLAVLTRKLRAAAMTDALTDLPNRRYAMKRMDVEWATSDRQGGPLSVIMIDIDHFKSVNDEYGHDVGDAALQATARAINRTLRRGDICARMGGEEFLVICPNADREGALHVAERIREAVEENQISCDGYEGSLTISLGVGTRTPDMESIDALLKEADEAVYDAKRSGRNRVGRSDPPQDERKSA